MVSAALHPRWSCAFANDISTMKCATYAENWCGNLLIGGDIASLDEAALRQPIDLFWASSPCQDFSLAGVGKGLSGPRGSVFEVWIDKVRSAVATGFAPKLIAFENVVGLLTRSGGRDFVYVLNALSQLGYRVGAMEIDARAFLPQSRPRLFVIASRLDVPLDGYANKEPNGPFHTKRILSVFDQLPRALRDKWVWWSHERPAVHNLTLETVLDHAPDTKYFDSAEIGRLRAMMSEPSRLRLEEMLDAPGRRVGTIYKRGRPDSDGTTRQRAELRTDGVAGCLRTPGGGSSRQTLVITQGGTLRARLMSTRELSRLMGLPDSYRMPARYNDAYRVAGDGVVVPVVKYLDEQIFSGLLTATSREVAA